MSEVYVVRWNERQLDWVQRMLMTDNTIYSRDVPRLLDTARPEHPERREALEELGKQALLATAYCDGSHAATMIYGTTQEREAFLDALDKFRSLEGKNDGERD